tara:strand:+ start:383 stop:637 length:255 start_codon:yes stop_codon:yes gene_type:complete
MFYYVYMLKSITPGTKKTYVGYSNNVNLRLNKHNSNKGAKSTKGYKWILIYKKRFKSKVDAMKFEYKLKSNKVQRKIILESYSK